MTDEKDPKELKVPDVIGILPLRGTVLFPHAVVPLAAGRASSVQAIEEAARGGRLIGAVMQKDAAEDAPDRQGLYEIGTLAVIHKVLKQPDGSLRLVVRASAASGWASSCRAQPFLRARIESIAEPSGSPDVEAEALARSAAALFQKVVALSPRCRTSCAITCRRGEPRRHRGPHRGCAHARSRCRCARSLLEAVNVNERLSRLVAAARQGGGGSRARLEDPVRDPVRDVEDAARVLPARAAQGDPEGARRGDDRTHEVDELRAKIEAAGMTEEAKTSRCASWTGSRR
jgi:ATP-dependent Lon protease